MDVLSAGAHVCLAWHMSQKPSEAAALPCQVPMELSLRGIAVPLLQAKEIAYQFHMLCKN